MEKSRVFLFIGLFAASACQLAQAEPKCVDYDEQIQVKVFQPLKEQILKNNVSYYSLGSLNSGSYFGISLTATDGIIGNLSNFGLYYADGNTSNAASQMCVDSSTSEVVTTLSATFTLNTLQAVFDNLAITVPILPTIGNSKTTIQYQDQGIFANVTIQQTADKKCSATLNSLKIMGLGDVSVEFESGLINKIYAFVINRVWSSIKSLLNNYGVVDSANTALTTFGSKLVSQQAEALCLLVNTFSSSH